MKNIFMTICGLALLGAILYSNSVNPVLLVCSIIVMISFALVLAIEYKEIIKDRLAYLVAQVIIKYRSYKSK